MVAALQMNTGALAENVAVFSLGTTDQAIEIVGSGVRLRHVSAGTSGSDANQIVVTGNDAYLEDVQVSGTIAHGIEVTGDRAQLRGIYTTVCGTTTSGAGIRFNGSDDSILNGYASDTDFHGIRCATSLRLICKDFQILSTGRVGILLTSSNNCVFDGIIRESGRNGYQITDSSKNRISGQVINAGRATTNTYDGVLLDGNSDRNRTELTVAYLGSGNNMRYGLNISAATCDNNIEASLLNGAGATGAYNDAGTGTVLTDDHIV